MKSRVVLGTLTFSAALIGSGAALARQHDTRAQVQAPLAEANRTGTILSGDGTLWQDLGALHRLTGSSFFARTDSLSGMPVMTEADR